MPRCYEYRCNCIALRKSRYYLATRDMKAGCGRERKRERAIIVRRIADEEEKEQQSFSKVHKRATRNRKYLEQYTRAYISSALEFNSYGRALCRMLNARNISMRIIRYDMVRLCREGALLYELITIKITARRMHRNVNRTRAFFSAKILRNSAYV